MNHVVLGIDIGGANLKLADAVGRSISQSFPMWTEFSRLGAQIQSMLLQFAAEYNCQPACLAVTMTGELADCFVTRREGVGLILDEVAQAFPVELTHVYAVGGEWLTAAAAKLYPWRVAASNWHALAYWAHQSRIAERVSTQLLAVVDVGSTTVDVIPLQSTGVATDAQTDRDRLEAGQLVYTGMQRTPVAAILQSVKIDGRNCPVMAERFATSDDAYVALGLVAESPEDIDSADGRGRTIQHARSRLARMIGEDGETLSVLHIESLANQIIEAQATQVCAAILRNTRLEPPAVPGKATAESCGLLISGHGRPLIERVAGRPEMLDTQFLWLEDAVSPAAARSGPAMAVAWLFERHQQTTLSPT